MLLELANLSEKHRVLKTNGKMEKKVAVECSKEFSMSWVPSCLRLHWKSHYERWKTQKLSISKLIKKKLRVRD